MTIRSTCAVEYRTNFQSRAFEESLRRRRVRYKLVGGFSFYKRAEVQGRPGFTFAWPCTR